MELEKRVEKIETRVKTVEEAIILLTTLTTSHDDRLEKLLFGIEELRAGEKETNEKINMLIDAQIRSEDKMNEMSKMLAESQKDTNEKFKMLAESQKDTNKILTILADVQVKTETEISDITNSVNSAHQRIDKIEE